MLDDAREPILSADGQSLAFIRDDHGRGRLMVRTSFPVRCTRAKTALAPSSLNIYEASFLSKGSMYFRLWKMGSLHRSI